MKSIDIDQLARARENQVFEKMNPIFRLQLLKFLSDNGFDGMDLLGGYPSDLEPAVSEYYSKLNKNRVHGEGEITPHFDTTSMRIN
jgi:hypothetical protein